MKVKSVTKEMQILPLHRFATLLLALCIAAFGGIPGDASKLHSVLKALNSRLPQQLDVVSGISANHPFASRPRVTMLSDMQEGGDPGIHSDWMDDFRSGAIGMIGGVKSSGKSNPPAKATSHEAFFAAWDDATLEKKIFLSFTSADKELAWEVAKTLEKLGYVTFTFLREGDQTPPYDPDFVGQKFMEAGFHLVIDSEHARASVGVALEAREVKSIEGYRAKAEKPELGDFLRQVEMATDDWTLTENPDRPGDLFFHRTLDDGKLEDLAYIVHVEKDGSWSVHKALSSPQGTRLGELVGRIKNPPDHPVGLCLCCR